MTDNTVLPITTVLSIARMEQLWPPEERALCCTRTGQPWATIDETELHRISEQYRFDERTDVEFARAVVLLTAGPCPRWATITPTTIKRNMRYDPQGAYVFLLSLALQIDTGYKRGERVSKGPALFAIQREKEALWQSIASIPVKYLREANDILLIMYSENMLPTRALKNDKLATYSDSVSIHKLAKRLDKIATKRGEERERFDTAKKTFRRRAIYETVARSNISHLSEPAQNKILGALLDDIQNAFDESGIQQSGIVTRASTTEAKPPMIPQNVLKLAAMRGIKMEGMPQRERGKVVTRGLKLNLAKKAGENK